LIFFVVSYSQCNVLAGHHCVLEIIWSVISWYLSYHLSFQKNMGVFNFFLCVYYTLTRWVWMSWGCYVKIRISLSKSHYLEVFNAVYLPLFYFWMYVLLMMFCPWWLFVLSHEMESSHYKLIDWVWG
jgi:hypothetical protein